LKVSKLEKVLACEITKEFFDSYYCFTHVTTQTINQPTASGATISWLSQAHLDCYPLGQTFLILQRKTLTLLVTQQLMGRWTAEATVSALVDGHSLSLGHFAPLEHGWHLWR